MTDRLRRGVPAGLLLILALALAPAAAVAQDTGTLEGTVRDTGGDPIADIVLTVRPAACDEDTDCPEAVEPRSDAAGSWQAADLEPGDYLLAADDPEGWYLPWQREEPVTVEADEVTTVDVTMTLGGVLTGTVTGTDATPTDGVDVEVFPVDEGDESDPPPEPAGPATTDGDGEYTVAGLASGSYRAVFTPADDVHRSHGEEVVVTAEEVTTLDVELRPMRVPTERVAGSDRIRTAIAAARRAYPAGADVAFVASARSFPDALTAAPLAGAEGGPVLLVGDRLGSPLAEELRRLGVARVVIVGAVDAVSVVVQSELAALGLDVERIPGENRYDTTGLIARRVGLPASGEVAVASGRSFADALSVAPLAAAERIPVLLTDPARLPADTAAALRALDPQRTIVLGGQAAVSEVVADQLPGPERVGGADRYETSVAVADLFVRRGASVDEVFAATGLDFPDAIVAGPVAGQAGSPLVLVDGHAPDRSQATYAFLRRADGAITRVVVFGGDQVMSGAVVDALAVSGAGGGDD